MDFPSHGGESYVAKLFSDKYEIIDEIASGGMGVLYKANQLNLNRIVALKVLHAQFTSDPSFLKRFDREARAMARLDHQNIIRVYDVGQQENSHYIVMEYFPGKDLRWMMVEKGCFTPQETVEIAIQIAEALSFAHENGIIHRDIKPGNILINDRKVIKVGDFGIAAAADEVSLTSTGQVLGTPEYMAPEQAKGEPIDGRADLYALGLVMYKMLTGSSPYEGLSKMAIVGKLIYEKEDSALMYKQPVQNHLQQIILKLVRKEASLRYPNARALIDALNESREALILEAAQQKQRKKGVAAEPTAALETADISKEYVTPFPPMSASPVASGEPTAELNRVAAGSSGPKVVMTASKSKIPLAIGIGTAVLAGGIIFYGLWPAQRESNPSSPSIPPPSVPASTDQINRNGENTPTPSTAKNPSPSVIQKNIPPVQARTEPPASKPTAKDKSSEKKTVGMKTEGTVVKQPSMTSPVEPKSVPKKGEAPKVADAVPPGVEAQPLRPEEVEKERIREIVKRQEQAFESKNVELYLADLSKPSADDLKEINKAFEQYAQISVGFDIQNLSLLGDRATIKMIQTTRLVSKGPRPDLRTKNMVLWELGKVENHWKIQNMKILEKMD